MTTANITGTVQTLTCSRDGSEVYSKLVYIPAAQQADAYKAIGAKLVGVFMYVLRGEIKSVGKKPKGVDRWND